MGSSNIRDILTSFSPALDYLAICTGDGRIKIWDTLRGQVQTEFADITSTEATSIYNKVEKGHLSVDYTCMKWLSLEKKKKRKLQGSLLVLGTGGGDVLAVDVSAGQLKWRVSDCHPGGVSSVSFSTSASCIYSSGADGMICEIDPHSGNLLGKFKASTKAISCISVSPDGNILATASSQLRTFQCSNRKKIQKFSGHPGVIRCMAFTEDGKFILSSAVGERYIAIWSTDGGKKQSASCVLSMEHPAVFLDSRCINSGNIDESGLYVLSISETGVCYLWHAQNIEELRNAKPTKVNITADNSLSKGPIGVPTIFAAKLQGISKAASVHAFVACGFLVKPSFQKLLVQFGTHLGLNLSQDGVLIPMSQSIMKSKKGSEIQKKVTALDRAYADDAFLPVARIANFDDKTNTKNNFNNEPDEMMVDLVDKRSQTSSAKGEDDMVMMEGDSNTLCMEDKLRSLGILSTEDDRIDSTVLKGIDLEVDISQKKIKSVVLSMTPADAYKSLKALVALWQSRSYDGKYALPWIYSILVNHSQHIMSQEPKNHEMLNFLLKSSKSRGVAIQHLLQLSGRLQLIKAQVDKATQSRTQILTDDQQLDESEDEDEHFYGEEDNESEISSDDDN